MTFAISYSIKIVRFQPEQMEHADMSVRELAARSGVSPSTIQHLRTGKAENIKVKTLLSVLHELGYSLKPVAAV